MYKFKTGWFRKHARDSGRGNVNVNVSSSRGGGWVSIHLVLFYFSFL